MSKSLNFVVKKKDLKNINAFSLYDLYGHTLAQDPLPREP